MDDAVGVLLLGRDEIHSDGDHVSTYLAYPKKENTPSRLTRKQARRGIFMKNRKLAKLERTKRRLARRALETPVEGE